MMEVRSNHADARLLPQDVLYTFSRSMAISFVISSFQRFGTSLAISVGCYVFENSASHLPGRQMLS